MTQEEYKKYKELHKSHGITWKSEEVTLYEWLVQYSDSTWSILDSLRTEEQMKKLYVDMNYHKTGRKFKIQDNEYII